MSLKIQVESFYTVFPISITPLLQTILEMSISNALHSSHPFSIIPTKVLYTPKVCLTFHSWKRWISVELNRCPPNKSLSCRPFLSIPLSVLKLSIFLSCPATSSVVCLSSLLFHKKVWHHLSSKSLPKRQKLKKFTFLIESKLKALLLLGFQTLSIQVG